MLYRLMLQHLVSLVIVTLLRKRLRLLPLLLTATQSYANSVRLDTIAALSSVQHCGVAYLSKHLESAA